MGSFRNINYRLRPAKAVERKMLCEAFAKLSAFASLHLFQYVGFGSTYFSDFVLVHRLLGINRLISIEREEEFKERFKLNLPFDCVELKFGESGDVLAELDFKQPNIVWLDYDGTLDKSVLEDIRLVFSSVSLPSMVVLTVNAHPHTTKTAEPKIDEIRLERLKSAVGETKVPIELSGKSLQGWGTAQASYRIISDEIKSLVGELTAIKNMTYEPLFHFQYDDGAKMLTMGGLLFDTKDQAAFDSAGFHALPFVRTKDEAYQIKVPALTFREMRFLDQYLPNATERMTKGILPVGDVKAYAEIYRYFPMFAETDI